MWSSYVRIRFQLRAVQICKMGSPAALLFKNGELIILEGKSNAKYFPIFWWCLDEDRIVLTELLGRTEVCLA